MVLARMVTVIIPTYMRPENVSIVIASIRAQTVKTHVLVWDNGAKTSKPFTQHDLADEVISSSTNWGCWARFPACAFVRTPYIWQMDDDLRFTANDVLAKYVHLSQDVGDLYAIGAGGKVLSWDGPPDGHYPNVHQTYQNSKDSGPGPQVMVNTGFTLFPTALMNEVPMNPTVYKPRRMTDELLRNADDPWICSFMPTYVAPWGWEGIARLSECGMGVSHETHHMNRRNIVCEQYLREKYDKMVKEKVL